jgi:hypothetical protein
MNRNMRADRRAATGLHTKDFEQLAEQLVVLPYTYMCASLRTLVNKRCDVCSGPIADMTPAIYGSRGSKKTLTD